MNRRLQYLLENARSGNATPGELDELLQLIRLNDNEINEQVNNFHASVIGLSADNYDKQYWQSVLSEIFKQDNIVESAKIKTLNRVHFLKMTWFKYAAAIIILFGIGAYLWITSQNKLSSTGHDQIVSDISPGRQGAILTLVDGKQIVLDSVSNGIVASQNGADVVLKNGLLKYDPDGKAVAETAYNTMTTTKGRQFQLILPDGSKVWLNATSSIKYPTIFSGKERVVEIEGEAYFEIVRNMKMPFKVKSGNGAEVEVLGTSFNISTYTNEEALTTTLIDGAVKIKSGKQSVILRPSQQAKVNINKKIDVINNADISQATAWKNGYFDFNKADVKIMMRQLERWYDVEVVYEGDIPDVVFKGKMDRNVKLSGVVRFLKIFGIKARLENRVLIISQS